MNQIGCLVLPKPDLGPDFEEVIKMSSSMTLEQVETQVYGLVGCIETQNPITQALSKNSTLNFFIHVMLYLGGKSCFLMEKLKVGNRDQTELDTDGQSVKF